MPSVVGFDHEKRRSPPFSANQTKGLEMKLQTYTFYLANGDLFARLTFTKAAIKAWWPDARIVRNKVYLA